MKHAALSARRSMRSALENRLLASGSWTQSSSFGVSSLSPSQTNEDVPCLSSRLSERLTSTSDLGNSALHQPNGARGLTTRAKRSRLKKEEPKKAAAIRTKHKSSLPQPVDSMAVQPAWTAVGAALSSLEESISRTNLLLHSLASGEAWARRIRPPQSRLNWSEKSSLDSVTKKKDTGLAHTTTALTSLLQELSQKQAVATDLLSRLGNITGEVPPAVTSSRKPSKDVFSRKVTSSPEDLKERNKRVFESGWGPNTLAPPLSQDPSPSLKTSPRPNTIDGTSALIDGTSISSLRGVLEPDAVFLESVRDLERIIPIPALQHGLDRVLFNPGVHWLQDPHSRVYNFPPELQAMPAFTSFAYGRVNSFITSSKDNELANLAKRQGKRFTGSTSSVSMILAHLYFLVSNWRDVDLSVLSASFIHMPKDFSAGQKMPYTFYMRQNDGVVAFDSGSQSDDPLDQNVLSYIGVMLEKLLTLPKDDFETLLLSNPAKAAGETVLPEREAYRYSVSKSMVLRSQLDCADSRLPGTGVFDLKTRAAISVRQDIWNLEVGSGYQIRSTTGPLESFEREYYDLCRSAFLKYSFQVRIGAMDGVFVAYHNTSRMFGFQYVPLEEMDKRLFGSHEAGERVFRACLGLLEVVAENITSCFPKQDIKVMVCTSESKEPELSLWVEPAEWNEETSAPVYELRLNIHHTVNGESVPSGAQVTFEKPDWKINYDVSKFSPSAETKARRDKMLARQQSIRTSCLPEGTTIEEFSHRMKDGVLEGYAPRSSNDVDAEVEAEGDDMPSNTFDAWNKRFRTQATPLVNSLRALSKKGLEDLNKWTQDESPKVVYKSKA